MQFQVNDLTLFFVKYMYHIPSNHILIQSRLWIVGLLSVNAAKEYFEFIKHRSKFRRINILLLISIVATEIALVLRHHDSSYLLMQMNSLMLTSILKARYFWEDLLGCS
jgi:hypothetical protein